MRLRQAVLLAAAALAVACGNGPTAPESIGSGFGSEPTAASTRVATVTPVHPVATPTPAVGGPFGAPCQPMPKCQE